MKLETSKMPRVLIADSLSPAAIDIFRQRGVDVDVKTGLAKEDLIAIIGDYDGLVVTPTPSPIRTSSPRPGT